MTHKEQVQSFLDELNKVVARYSDEFDLTITDAIGVLEIVKLDIYQRAQEDSE